MAEKQAQNTARLTNFIVILILLIVASIGVVFGIILPVIEASPIYMVAVPRIETNCISTDGKSHLISADFALELDKDRELDTESIQEGLTSLIGTLSYEQMTGLDGLSYVKSKAKEYLETQISGEVKFSVYISDFANDFILPADSSGAEQRSDIFKGLFPNAK